MNDYSKEVNKRVDESVGSNNLHARNWPGTAISVAKIRTSRIAAYWP